jgi:hypothetical protein
MSIVIKLQKIEKAPENLYTRYPTNNPLYSDQTTGKFERWRENGPPSGRTCALGPIQIAREMPHPPSQLTNWKTPSITGQYC